MTYEAEWLTEVKRDTGRYHRLGAWMNYRLGNDGIGSYECWGAICYDEGKEYIEDAWPVTAYLVRTRRVARREDIPKIKGISNIMRGATTREWYYDHAREIDLDTEGIEELSGDFADNYDFKEALGD
jgi:hypothetical protein